MTDVLVDSEPYALPDFTGTDSNGTGMTVHPASADHSKPTNPNDRGVPP